MPDILIRGMEMPKNCAECPVLSQWDDCGINHEWKFADEFDKTKDRLPSCPLLSLPEGHGELIDKQAFIADIAGFIECMTKAGVVVDGEMLWGKLLDALDNAETIVSADVTDNYVGSKSEEGETDGSKL